MPVIRHTSPIDLLQYHKLTRAMHSSASHLLSVPRHNLSFGSRAFHISAPKVYGIPYLLTFCSLKHSLHLDVILKTHYFQSAYPAPSTYLNAP